MITTIEFKIKKENEFEFYEELFKLYNAKTTLSSFLILDDNLMKLTKTAVDNTDLRVETVFENVHKYCIKQRDKKEVYKLISKETSDDFYASMEMAKIVFISNLHFLREPFIGKGSSIEFKLLLVQISQILNGIATGISEGLSNSLESAMQKTLVLESLKPLILEQLNNNEDYEMPDDICFYSYDGGFKPIVINYEDDGLDCYIESDNGIMHAVINEQGLCCDYYYSERNLEELKLDDLIKYKSLNIQKEVVDVIKSFGENDDWKEKVDMEKIEIIDYSQSGEESTILGGKESIGNSVFKQLEEFFLRLIKQNPNKEDEIYYRDLVINKIFTSLKEEYSSKGVSDHILKNITGVFCSNLGLLKSEDEHLNGPSLASYTTQLRKGVENTLSRIF